MKKTIVLTLLGALLQLTTSCQTTTMETEKFEWLPGVGAPKNYPVRIHSGDFYNGNTWVSIPSGGILEEGWGEDGMKMAVGEDLKPVPERFKITYLSFIENQFYTGEFTFPHDTVVTLFKEGFIDLESKQQDTYSSIIIGLAPGGVIVLWLGGASKKVEIGRYQATKTDMDWEFFNPQGEEDRDKYVNGVLERRPKVLAQKKQGIQFGLWDTYRIKYNWRPKVILPEGCTLKDIAIERFFNAEEEGIFRDALAKNVFTKRAIPMELYLIWQDDTGISRVGEFHFKEQDIFKAYKEIYQEDRDKPIELVFKLNDQKTAFEVYLQSDTEEIVIPNIHQGIFKMTQHVND